MKTLTLEEFHAQAKTQKVIREDVAFICPMCGTVQSSRLLISEGVGACYESVKTIIGFNCVGRYTGKGSPSGEKGKNHGCNWTLGGLFQTHELEVITPDGKHVPCFELATAEQAQELVSSLGDFHRLEASHE